MGKILQLPDEEGKANFGKPDEKIDKEQRWLNIDSVIVEGGGALNWSMVAKATC